MSDAFKPLLSKLADGHILSEEDAEAFFSACLRGEPSSAQVAAALTACGKKEDMPAPAPMSAPAPAPTPVSDTASAAVTESVEAAKAIGNAASVAANATGNAASAAVGAAVSAAKNATAPVKKEKKGGC